MELLRTSLILILLICFFSDSILAQEFGYEGQNGPSEWGKQYDTCFGKHQSPININLLTVQNVRLPPMELNGFSNKMLGLVVNNNGHTVMIKSEGDENLPTITKGPLAAEYKFSQLHFHWGYNDSVGSEDKINSKSFPMELHMVFFKKEYGDPKNALEHHDGLAVLAFFYELDRFRHPGYDLVTAALENVTEPHTSVPLTHGLSFFDLLPYDLERYFTYSGSLTTPPCSEVVTWIDYEQPIRLSPDQIEGFRNLRSDHGKITHNFRPLQPLGDRTVYYNSDRDTYFDNSQEGNNVEYNTIPNAHRRSGSYVTTPNGSLLFSLLLGVLYVYLSK